MQKSSHNQLKNLILVHIESLSTVLYYQNRSLFHNINNLMVIGDLLYGDFKKFELSRSLSDLISIDNIGKSLLAILKERGYNVANIFYPAWSNEDRSNLEKIVGQVSFKYNEEDFYKEISDCIVADQPFALYVYNGMSGISFLSKSSGETWSDSWIEGYKNADKSIGYIFSILKKNKILDKTIVVIFGDHGDDFWSHAFNGGYCHSIEPYTSLTHTPLIVHNTDIGAQVVPDIISVLDIKELCLSMLGLDAYISENSKIYHVYRCSRKNAFARNLYVNQLIQLVIYQNVIR